MEIQAKLMKKPNEQSAREAFITILRSLTGREYMLSNSPDEVNRRTPDVDFVLALSSDVDDKIAVEHTTVESFDGQRRDVNRWSEVVHSVNDGCRHRIPPDRYYFLAAQPQIVAALVGEKRRGFISDLTPWVAKTAPTLVLADSDMQIEYEGQKITLICGGYEPTKLNGRVWGILEEPENQKHLQDKRLRRAVEDKLPKLTKYKGQPGFKTALLLEDVAGTLGGSTLSRCKGLEEVDYIVVFVSNEDQMIVGNVWKEDSVWYSFVPCNRRFSFHANAEKPTPKGGLS
jgi:hypothetical protein